MQFNKMIEKKKKNIYKETEQSEQRNSETSMADRRTNNNGSSSSSSLLFVSSTHISEISHDQLLPILLLLPVESIVSFAMTCKRFRALASPDSLWETICRRDWGPSSIEALKFSLDGQHRQQIPWMRVYQQVYQLDSVSCHKLCESKCDTIGDEVFPKPRASHSLNFVSGCLVLFGGGCEGGRHLDDTWVASIGNDFRRILKWRKIDSGIPTGRFGHSCVVIGDCLVLFGGINDHGIRHNDTWVGQIALNENLGITLSWRPVNTGSIAPQPRGAHAGCCIDNRRMLIHGGIGLSGKRLGDTWILDLSENFSFGTWCEIVTHPSPPPRSGHTLTSIGGTQTVLFGGRGLVYEVLNDVWLFDTSEGLMRWVQLLYELRNIPGGLPLPRVGHSATLILGGRLLIYGGEDTNRHRKDDFWVLDISPMMLSTKMQALTPNQKEILAIKWRRLKSKGYKPNCRSFHQACSDNSGRYLYVFGGMVDGMIQPAEQHGLMFDGEHFVVELMLQV